MCMIKKEYFFMSLLLHQHTELPRVVSLFFNECTWFNYPIWDRLPLARNLLLNFFTSFSWKHVAFVEFDLILNLGKIAAEYYAIWDRRCHWLQPHVRIFKGKNITKASRSGVRCNTLMALHSFSISQMHSLF